MYVITLKLKNKSLFEYYETKLFVIILSGTWVGVSLRVTA